jgi:hypothetical protein
MIEKLVSSDEIARTNARLRGTQFGDIGICEVRCLSIIHNHRYGRSIAELLARYHDPSVDDMSFNSSHTNIISGSGRRRRAGPSG